MRQHTYLVARTLAPPRAGKPGEPQEPLIQVRVCNSTATLETGLAVSQKTKNTVTYHPAVVFLGIFPEVLKMYVHTTTRTWVFIEAVFITATTWKKPRRPAVGEWASWHMQTAEYSSALKGNELSTCEDMEAP